MKTGGGGSSPSGLSLWKYCKKCQAPFPSSDAHKLCIFCLSLKHFVVDQQSSSCVACKALDRHTYLVRLYRFSRLPERMSDKQARIELGQLVPPFNPALCPALHQVFPESGGQKVSSTPGDRGGSAGGSVAHLSPFHQHSGSHAGSMRESGGGSDQLTGPLTSDRSDAGNPVSLKLAKTNGSSKASLTSDHSSRSDTLGLGAGQGGQGGGVASESSGLRSDQASKDPGNHVSQGNQGRGSSVPGSGQTSGATSGTPGSATRANLDSRRVVVSSKGSGNKETSRSSSSTSRRVRKFSPIRAPSSGADGVAQPSVPTLASGVGGISRLRASSAPPGVPLVSGNRVVLVRRGAGAVTSRASAALGAPPSVPVSSVPGLSATVSVESTQAGHGQGSGSAYDRLLSGPLQIPGSDSDGSVDDVPELQGGGSVDPGKRGSRHGSVSPPAPRRLVSPGRGVGLGPSSTVPAASRSQMLEQELAQNQALFEAQQARLKAQLDTLLAAGRRGNASQNGAAGLAPQPARSVASSGVQHRSGSHAMLQDLYTPSHPVTGEVPVAQAVDPSDPLLCEPLPDSVRGYEVELDHFKPDLESSDQAVQSVPNIFADRDLLVKCLAAGSVPDNLQALAQAQLMQGSVGMPPVRTVPNKVRPSDLGAKKLKTLARQVDLFQVQAMRTMADLGVWDEPPKADVSITGPQPAMASLSDDEESSEPSEGLPVPAMLARHILECWRSPGDIKGASRPIRSIPRLWWSHFKRFVTIPARPTDEELGSFQKTREQFTEQLASSGWKSSTDRASQELGKFKDMLRVFLASAAWKQVDVAVARASYNSLTQARRELEQLVGVPQSVLDKLSSARDNQETLMLAAWCQFVMAFAGVDCAAKGIAAAVVQLRKDACFALWGKNCPAKVFETVLKRPVSTESFFGGDIRVMLSEWACQQSVLALNSAAVVNMGGDPIIRGTKRQNNSSGGGAPKKQKGNFKDAAKKGRGGKKSGGQTDPAPQGQNNQKSGQPFRSKKGKKSNASSDKPIASGKKGGKSKKN